jgi:hypothetical protein
LFWPSHWCAGWPEVNKRWLCWTDHARATGRPAAADRLRAIGFEWYFLMPALVFSTTQVNCLGGSGVAPVCSECRATPMSALSHLLLLERCAVAFGLILAGAWQSSAAYCGGGISGRATYAFSMWFCIRQERPESNVEGGELAVRAPATESQCLRLISVL